MFVYICICVCVYIYICACINIFCLKTANFHQLIATSIEQLLCMQILYTHPLCSNFDAYDTSGACANSVRSITNSSSTCNRYKT